MVGVMSSTPSQRRRRAMDAGRATLRGVLGSTGLIAVYSSSLSSWRVIRGSSFGA